MHLEGPSNPFPPLDNVEEAHEGDGTQEEQEEGEASKEPVGNPMLIPELSPLSSSNSPSRSQALSPSYAEMAKRRPLEAISTSEEEPFEKSTKRQGRKSNRELREEEAESQKMQGNQSKLDNSFTKNPNT